MRRTGKFSLLSLALLFFLTATGQESLDSILNINEIDVLDEMVLITECGPGEVAADDINFHVGIIMNAGNSELAPYYIASNNWGAITQQYST